MKMRKLFYRATAMLLSLVMFFAGMDAWASSSEVFADTEVPMSGIDYVRYDAIYEEANERFMVDKISLETIYEKYGDMNGDYYRIALEEVILLLDGRVAGLHANIVSSQLVQNGEISRDTRKTLREAVTTYGLPEDLIPFDPQFLGRTTTTTMGDGWTTEMSRIQIQTRREWEEKHGLEPADPEEFLDPFADSSSTPAPAETATPTVTPAPTETPAPQVNTVFADVAPDAWYAEAVGVMAASGLIKGKDDGLFHPDDIITVGEWCTILHRIIYSDADKYTGVPGYTHWAAIGVQSCSGKGLTRMGLGGEAYPEGGDTCDAIAQRGEAIQATTEIYERLRNNGSSSDDRDTLVAEGPWTWDDIPDADVVQKGTEHQWKTNGGGTYPDYRGTHYWKPLTILNAYNYGITNGIDSTGTCNPSGTMTRAQACKMLYEAGLDHNVRLYSHGSGASIR